MKSGKLTRMRPSASLFSSDYVLKLDCSDLLVGMFVSELDSRRSDAPFPLNGFHLRKNEDIRTLQKFCKFVYIDTNRGVPPRQKKARQLTMLSRARKSARVSTSLNVKRDTYPVTHAIKQQIDKAFRLYTKLQADFLATTQAVRANGKLEFAELDKPIDGLVDIIIANPQSLIWLLNTDPSKSHQVSYCVRAAIWATILARQIGINRNEMKVLFLGTLLADIGMHLLPLRLVNKRGSFRKKEFLAYKKHVELGLKLLSAHQAVDDRIVGILRCHHERHDGLGFPRGLKGGQIPGLARIANLAYSFERLLRKDSDTQSVSPAKAMAKLYKQRELKFPEQLVVEFIHTMGTYPAGTVVELASGELALVLEQNSTEKLFPKLAYITNAEKMRLNNPRVLDLPNRHQARRRHTITSSSSVDCCNIDSSEFTFRFCGKRIGIGALGFRL